VDLGRTVRLSWGNHTEAAETQTKHSESEAAALQYLLITYLVHEEDDPTESYVELDENRMERRRMDFYQNGMCFAYGGDHGWPEALSKTPYPESPYSLNRPGEVEAQPVSLQEFQALWFQLPERPTGFMDALF